MAHSVKRQDLPNSKFALYSWTSAKILTNGATSISKDEVSKLGASGAGLLEDYLEQPHQFRSAIVTLEERNQKNLEQLGLPYLEASWSYKSSTRRGAVAFGQFQDSDTEPHEA